MKKIIRTFIKYYKYLFSKNGREILRDKFKRNHYRTSLSVCFLPYRYNGKYKNEFEYFRKTKKIVSIPYLFSQKYKIDDVKVFFDEDTGLPYVFHNEKKLFFPLEKKENINEVYNQLLIEQDINSPHRYFIDIFTPNSTDIFVDIGCAEAMSTLDVIDTVSEAYIFEFDNIWTKPLEMTFNNYGEKIHIIKKYVSDETNESCTTIDDIFNNISGENIFIKIDVEGAEERVLNGALKTFSKNNIKCLCCTYHNDDDAVVLSNWFIEHGFEFEFSNGVIFFEENVNLKGELFRKALIRASNYTTGS